jgi:hypothetical protein
MMLDSFVLLTRLLIIEAEHARQVARDLRLSYKHWRLLQLPPHAVPNRIVELVCVCRCPKEVTAGVRPALHHRVTLGADKVILILAVLDGAAL